MKDVHQEYRKQVYETLNGAVSYNSTVVPVYTYMAEPTGDLYIVLGATSGTPSNNNKAKFLTSSVLTIDIVHFQTRGVSTAVVDDVYGQCMELLITAPFTPGFTLASPFKAANIEVIMDDHIFEQGLDKVVRKVFRLRCEIEQDEIF